jgi:tRNA-splicing ligase RtcB
MGRAVAVPSPAAGMHRIVLDDGGVMCCSTMQDLMRRDGNYASELAPGMSLMPLYVKRDREGYLLVQQNYSGRWQRGHWIVARCGLLGPIPRFEGQRTVIHHRNFDTADNRPANLGFMGDRDHSTFHRSLVDRNEHWQSEEFEARRVAALARKASTPEGHAYFAERGTKNIVRYMNERPEHFRAAVAGNGKRGAPTLAQFNTSEKGREQAKRRANKMYRCETCGEEVKSYIGLHNHRRWRHGYNHAIAAIVACAPSDLVCVAAEHGNFAVGAGVFVRACLPLAASPKSYVAAE